MPINVLQTLRHLGIALPLGPVDPQHADHAQAAKQMLQAARKELTPDWTADRCRWERSGYKSHILGLFFHLNHIAKTAAEEHQAAPVALHEWKDVLNSGTYESLHPLVQYSVKELLYFLYRALTELHHSRQFEALLHVYVCPFYLARTSRCLQKLTVSNSDRPFGVQRQL